MATNPIFIYDNGRVVVPEELRDTEYLHNGVQLELVSIQNGLTLLPVRVPESRSSAKAISAWNSLADLYPDWKNPQQQADAALRKQRAAEALDLLYSSGCATASALKAAEREWELADDALDFGITGR